MTESTERLISSLAADLEPVQPLPRLRSAFATVLAVSVTILGLATTTSSNTAVYSD